MIGKRLPLAVASSALLALAACGITTRPASPPSSVPTSAPTSAPTIAPSSPSPTSPTSPTTTPTTSSSGPPPDAAHRVLAAMSESQRVGQLFMVGTPATGAAPAVIAQVKAGSVGAVFLAGNSTLPAAQTATMVANLQQLAGAVGLYVATDQEGGTVQRLKGPSFSVIPSALSQGSSGPATETANARTWGQQLARAGINLDLAPVMDTVPSAAFAPDNPPIGALDREFGYSTTVVATVGTAFLQALLASGIDTTTKHFPGLGRVTANTDTSSSVTDAVTTATDAYLQPFAAAINAGTPFVMMSTAIYTKIDPANPAAFSSTVINTILRDTLHFGGVVISDDLGAAKQVAGYSVGDRAVRFIAAGGDVVLTVAADQIAPMAAAVLARAATDPGFASTVNSAALQVLEAKQARGLLH